MYMDGLAATCGSTPGLEPILLSTRRKKQRVQQQLCKRFAVNLFIYIYTLWQFNIAMGNGP
jgi:hypothetical protein